MEREVFYRAKGQVLGFKDLVSLHNTTGDLWAKRGERGVLNGNEKHFSSQQFDLSGVDWILNLPFW